MTVAKGALAGFIDGLSGSRFGGVSSVNGAGLFISGLCMMFNALAFWHCGKAIIHGGYGGLKMAGATCF